MRLIETKTLGTAAASIEFTSIPQDRTDLVILGSVRSNNTSVTLDGGYDPFLYRFNGNSSGYTARTLEGNGSVAGSGGPTTRTSDIAGGTWGRLTDLGINNANTTSNTFTNLAFYVPNYAGSTNKSSSLDLVKETNATAGGQCITAALWSNTAAITSVSFALGVGSYVIGSTFSLYSITKGSDGIVTTS